MPPEYVEVLPDANGRALNDYPGLAGSHRLAFDGERLERVGRRGAALQLLLLQQYPEGRLLG